MRRALALAVALSQPLWSVATAFAQGAPAPSTNPVPPNMNPPLPTLPPTVGAPTSPAGMAIEAAGQAPIPNGDRVRAHDRALEECFRQAIDRAAAQIFDAATLAQRAAAIRLKIYPRARSYVTTYRVVEEAEQAGSFRVRIVADVALGRLERDLNPSPVARPPVATDAAPAGARIAVVCLAARVDGAWAASGSSERLAMALHARGIDARTVPAACERSIRSDGASAFDSAKAADAARSSGAAATLAGTVEAGPDGTIRGTPLLGAHASAALLLVEPNGRIAGEAHVEREGYGADPAHAQAMATDAALDAALASLSSAIASTWPAAAPAVEAGSTVTLHVAEWQRYADLQALLKSVSVLPGVSAVEPHRFTPRAVDVLVRSPMSSAALASALARAPGGRFLTTARDDGSVGVRISPEAPLAPQGQPAPGAAPPSWGSPAAPAPASGLP